MDLYQVCLPGEDYNFENAKNNAWYKLKKIDLSNIAFMFPSLKIAEIYYKLTHPDLATNRATQGTSWQRQTRGGV